MTYTKHIRTDENQILFRRFMLIGICITLVGVLFAQLIVATQAPSAAFKVHDRAGAWSEAAEPDMCDGKICVADTVQIAIG